MAEWRTPVFDRTMDDVKSVDRTSAAYQKGALNTDDLNRIEDNYKYLMAKLKSDAIFIPHRLRNYTETVLQAVTTPEYTLVECLKSTGEQYFNTGFLPNQDTRVVMRFRSTTSEGTQALFGARTGASANAFAIWLMSGIVQSQYGNVAYNTKPITTDYVKEIVYDFNKNVVTVDGTEVAFAEAEFTPNLPLYLLSINANGTADSRGAVGDFLDCQVYDGDVLVHDYISVLDTYGVPCAYDKVSGEYLYNAGSGDFAAGAEIEQTSDGTIYGYEEVTTTYTDWQEHNLPWLSEINRIRANYNALVRLFLVGLGLPVLAESNYLDYQEVNNWERIALVGKTMFENMEKEYVYSGTIDCGGDRLL